MNKFNRNKHQNIIKLMEEAAFATARLLQEGRTAEVPQLLVDSQDAAVALGSHIEKLYGGQTQTVLALEQYCNALYQVSVAMNEASLIALAESIEEIYAIYDEEFPEKKEIVFMPYNASMWDSLESVWMAARDDEDCEVYVVPIPYYDLDTNRKMKEFHYEGNLYPEYVPITHYKEFDLELHHPDMIFIHNPYDECNTVTSIAPEFYSSRIKDFTDKLVYIPYFVLPEINPKNQVAIEGMKHFCLLPGVLYADQVIVQSEDMRQIYINEYMKAIKAAGGEISRRELERKILGLGSPKFDKAVNTPKEDLDIPSDWLRIIEKPDDSWKKVVFYNTSIAAFLKDSEQMLEKIKDVLKIFKENQDDVALLWRPHPLMLQTIESMRPRLREAYLDIVQQYREEGWGIYDDTSDMDRAVVLSDAYYGDQSSVVQVYKETGKPVMIQDVHCVEKKKWQKNALAYFAYIDIDDIRWISNLRHNGLYSINLETNETKFHGRFTGAQSEAMALHSYVKKYKDTLVFFPQEGSVINLYNMKTGDLTDIPLKEWENNRCIVSGVVQKEDRFLLFPRYKNLPVLEFCITDKKVYKRYELSKSLQASDNRLAELTRNICCIGDCVWFCLYNTNKIVSLNLNTGREKIYVLDDVNDLQCIASDGEEIWLGSGTDVLIWDVLTNVLNRVPNVIEHYEQKQNEIVSIKITENNVIALPMWNGKISVIDKKLLKKSTYNLHDATIKKVEDRIAQWRDFMNADLVENTLIIHPVSLEGQIELNIASGEIRQKSFCLDEVTLNIPDLNLEKMQEENYNLQDFILAIVDDNTDICKLKTGLYGVKIFCEVKGD